MSFSRLICLIAAPVCQFVLLSSLSFSRHRHQHKRRHPSGPQIRSRRCRRRPPNRLLRPLLQPQLRLQQLRARRRLSQCRKRRSPRSGFRTRFTTSNSAERAVPQETLRALTFTKKGDKYDEEALRRDFMALWNTGRFDDIRLETEAGNTGGSSRLRAHRTPCCSLDQVRGHQIAHRIRNPRPLQRTQGRAVGRIAIRSRTRCSAPQSF